MKRALVVDDDARILALARRCLTRAGYQVLTANEFTDARVDIQTLEPEIVVVDVRLGDFNGMQLGLLAKNVRSDARVVIMSGSDDPVLRRDASLLGATYMRKPFQAADLLQAVKDPAGATETC